MTNLPPGWTQAMLGDVLRLNYGKALREQERSGDGFPVYGSNGTVGLHRDALTQGESLIVGRKGSVGEVHHSLGPSWPIDTTFYIDSFEGMPARFWYYVLRSLRLDSLDRATAIPGLNREDAYHVTIALPPLQEQTRIAAQLDTLLARVDLCRGHLDQVPAILKRFRESVLEAAMSGELTKEWREKQIATPSTAEWTQTKLHAVCDPSRTITYGVVKLGDGIEGGVPCLRTSNVRWLRVETEGMKRISPALSAEFSRTVLRGGEVLVNVRGTLGGVVTVAPEMRGWNVSREVAVVPVNGAIMDSAFLAFWIGAERSQRWLTKVAKGVAYTGINIADLRELPVSVPSLAEQLEIVVRVQSLFRDADLLDGAQLEAARRVNLVAPSLIELATRGMLVQQDPNDESASVLLTRIRQARSEPRQARPKNKQTHTARVRSRKEAKVPPRNEIPTNYLAAILAARGAITAEVLWSVSELGIDEFYEQLRDEEARGLLRERRDDLQNAARLLEHVA